MSNNDARASHDVMIQETYTQRVEDDTAPIKTDGTLNTVPNSTTTENHVSRSSSPSIFDTHNTTALNTLPLDTDEEESEEPLKMKSIMNSGMQSENNDDDDDDPFANLIPSDVQQLPSLSLYNDNPFEQNGAFDKGSNQIDPLSLYDNKDE